MKKSVIGILMLASMSVSYAQSLRSITIKNLTYPDQIMTIDCLDTACSAAVLDNSRIFRMETINQTIANRRGYRSSTNKLYSLTSDSFDNISRNRKEAYYGKAVGNTVVAAGAIVVDTVIAVPQMVIRLLSSKVDSIKDKKAAKRIKANLEGDIKEVVLREKYFREIKDYLETYNVSNEYVDEATKRELLERIERGEKLAEDYANGEGYLYQYATNQYSNCHVEVKVAGWANQLYIDGAFRGNYNSESENVEIDMKLRELDESRVCLLKK